MNILKCQYASRYFFNTAENYNTAAIILSILSALCILVPDTHKCLSLLLPLIFDTLVFVFYLRMGQLISDAALLRNHFDNIVLEFKNAQLSEKDLRKIQALILKSSSNNADCQRQISNTGRDAPPGVRDWYEFSKIYSDSEVVFECQKQNQWWNKEMQQRRIVTYPFIICLSIVCAVLAGYYLKVTWLEIVVCFGGIVVTFFDRIIENVRYFRLSLKIDDYCELLSTSKNKKQINALQALIESRRELRVVELNHAHIKNSKRLSEQYEKISKNS